MELLTEFKSILVDYLHQTEALITILKEEKDVFARNNQEEIVSLVDKKNVLLESFKQTDAKFVGILATIQQNSHHGSSDSEETNSAVLAFIQSCPMPFKQELQSLWSKLKSALSHCTDLNRINGTIIASRLHMIRRTLDVIKYGSEDSTISYGAKGEVVTASINDQGTKV